MAARNSDLQAVLIVNECSEEAGPEIQTPSKCDSSPDCPYTEEVMRDCMEDIRGKKMWLEARTSKCFKSWAGTFWWPAVVVGGWLGVYCWTLYYALYINLTAVLADSILLGFLLWSGAYYVAGPCALFLAYAVFELVSFRQTHSADEVTWLAEKQEVLVDCVSHHAAHPGSAGFEDAKALLEHVEEWLQRFGHTT